MSLRSIPLFPAGADIRARVFHELMPFKVHEILLVSSPYDAFILEEDGSLATRIINEYRGLNLSRPPRLTRVDNADQALEALEERRYDLVLAMPNLGGMDCRGFGGRVKERFPHMPVILLAHGLQDLQGRDPLCRAIDETFVWHCDTDLLLAVVKSVEDARNVEADIATAGVRVILLVEDSPLYRGRILPMLYHELVRQTQAVLDEGLSEEERLLKMRARPKILTARTYEQALALFDRFRDAVFAVISDIRFPRKGRLDSRAGLDLLTRFRSQVPDLPLLALSTETRAAAQARAIPAVFEAKDSPGLGQRLHAFFLDYLGFGDFIFRLPEGREVGRAANLREFEQLLRSVPGESLCYHAARNHFFNWVMARGEVGLASRLHRGLFSAEASVERMRQDMADQVRKLRRLRSRGVAVRFDPRTFDPQVNFLVRLGEGSMGGKARGLVFMSRCLVEAAERLPAEVRIPRACIVTTDWFETFVRVNGLALPREEESDAEIARRFQAAQLPRDLVDQLSAWAASIPGPLSVRSSSMLEDAQARPYAGLFATVMLPPDPDHERRVRSLERAVKTVYASTWFAAPRAFARGTGGAGDNVMGVIVQELVGQARDGLFYPLLSGTADSRNVFPVPPMRPGDGIAHIALGFGRSVVEGERSLRFSPAHPRHLPQFSTVEDILAAAQQRLYVLDLEPGEGAGPGGEERGPAGEDAADPRSADNLRLVPVDQVAASPPVSLACSTFLPGEGRIRDAHIPGGVPVPTFAALLKYEVYPLAPLIAAVLDVGRQGMGCDVEIEFALDCGARLEEARFHLLQIRPMARGGDGGRVRIARTDLERALISSTRVLGHGHYQGIRDILLVVREHFDVSRTRDVAREVGRFNHALEEQGRPYLLIGPGRWGTADPWLGIPVRWQEVSGMGALVEIAGWGLEVEFSQGSHFFQNISSLDIPCMSVDPGDGDRFDQQAFAAMPVEGRGAHLVHLRVAEPLLIKVDARSGQGVCLPGTGREDQSRR